MLYEVWHLWEYLSYHRQRQMKLLLLLMLISSLCDLVSLGMILPFLGALTHADRWLRAPQLLPLLNFFQIQTATQLVVGLALMFMTTAIVAGGIRILTLHVQTRFGAKIVSEISCQLYQKTLRQPYSFFLDHNSSDLIQTAIGDTRILTHSIVMPYLDLCTSSCVAISLSIGLLFIDWRITIFTVVILGGSYGILYIFRRNFLRLNSQSIAQANQRQIKIVQESLGGIRDILLGETHGFFQSTYQELDEIYRNALSSNLLIASVPRHLIEAIAIVTVALLILLVSQRDDIISIFPVLGSLAFATNRILPSLQRIFQDLSRIQGARASLQRILLGLQRPVKPLLGQKSTPLRLKQELCFENVWFRYGNDISWVLQGVELRIAARTTVGFVGKTGSGKSTMADLVLGLLQPQRGTIWIDNHPLEGKRLQQWQRSIAHVPQSIFLADVSIAENIAFGIPKQQIDIERVCEAARLANIDQFIRDLPAQYDTGVGEKGVRLSGGQRQRIGIARALYKQASLIVFDEATSALDEVMEKDVMKAIDGLSHELTMILIAHRSSSLEKCDYIYRLHQGRINSWHWFSNG